MALTAGLRTAMRRLSWPTVLGAIQLDALFGSAARHAVAERQRQGHPAEVNEFARNVISANACAAMTCVLSVHDLCVIGPVAVSAVVGMGVLALRNHLEAFSQRS